MNQLRNTLLLCAIVAGSLLVGCNSAPSRTLGAPFAAAAPIAVQALATHAKSSSVVVQGEMIEKCPVAGCWFVLKDRTGVVRVDTKAAGFVVSEVPLHARLTVAGTVTADSQPGIAATGVRY
jgi:uncharacterized protein YdeI (BOF family)